MISRNAKILAAAGAAVVLTGGAVGATQLDKAVNLSVDGTASSAHVFGSTVGDVLDNQGIAVKPGDVVVPAADAPISDGDTITVKYARLLTLTVDGKTRQLRTTETTVDGALLALGLRGEGARLSVSRSQTIGRQGLTVSIVTPKAVTVVVDGKTTKKTIAAATVGEALTQLGVRVGKADKVNPPVTTRLTSGVKIAVQRVQTKDKKVNESIAFGTTKKKTSDLYADQTKVSRAGVAGVRTVTVRTTVVDGKVVSTKAISSKVTKAPVDRIVLVGTKARPVAAPSPKSTRQHQHHHPQHGWLDLGCGHQPGPRGHVGRHRPVRVHRQLAHQHRQRLLRRPPVPHLHVARLRRWRLRLPRRPRLARAADHRGEPRLRRQRHVAVELWLSRPCPTSARGPRPSRSGASSVRRRAREPARSRHPPGGIRHRARPHRVSA